MTGELLVRRFPPPIPGLPNEQARYKTILTTLAEQPAPPTRSEFVQPCQAAIERTHDDTLSDSWTRHIISDLARSGFIRESTDIGPDDDERLAVGIDSQRWLDGELSFADCVYNALKRSWVLRAEYPEGFEALERVLHAITYECEQPASSRSIKATLETEYGYQFSQQGLRGYPELLGHLGYLEEVDGGYQIPETVDPEQALTRLRKPDLFRKYENYLKREGALGEHPPKSAKRALMKYYMYRESGGWSKRKQWYRRFHRHYLKPTARDGDNMEPNLQRKDEFRDVETRRRDLRTKINNQYKIGESRLRGLSTDDLQRIHEAGSQKAARQELVKSGSGLTRADLTQFVGNRSYAFPDEFALYDWQVEAADTWFTGTDHTAPQEGIAEVVTGAGKTVMALEVIRRWLDKTDDGVVTIVVPTKVLMYQWLTELTQKLNVPIEDLGWAGDGHRDAFVDDDIKVLVTIVNTAVKDDYLASCLEDAGTPPHLLVADECHNYTGDVHSNVLEYHHTATLGLSATPTEKPHSERDPSDDEADLFDRLGEPFYTLTYSEAIERELIPSFTINYVGFDLAPTERQKYESLSREITDALKEIRTRYANRLYQLNGNLHQKLHTILNSDESPHPAVGQFFTLTQQRRNLVQNAVARQAITLRLLEEIDPDEKAIVFQERIEQLKQLIAPYERLGQTREREVSKESASGYRSQLYDEFPELKEVDKAIEDLFAQPDYWPVMYHSGHRREVWNEFAMEWFRADDHANVMLSVKALIEGVDVPDADTGIIRVSSGSVRQRIQTLGRILRTGDNPDRQSELYVLYARDTVDENIFREYDWEDQLGNADVEHRYWEVEDSVLEGELVEGDRPEVQTYTEPSFPDVTDLEPGDPYQGPTHGYKISVDAEGRPFERTGSGRSFITNEEVKAAAQIVYRLKGGGTIHINERGHMTTKTDDKTVYLGETAGPDSFKHEEATQGQLTDDPPEFDDLFGGDAA
ncbi:DEAD/DEAH box helicase [Halorubrum sp. DTA98]|uniref:DEAD/DEAH box helicase n=1 Tax=Halorubrum sp. DTA98 TaxID=3402163 RepID=UPI003AABD65A